jgi:hypothetical protein
LWDAIFNIIGNKNKIATNGSKSAYTFDFAEVVSFLQNRMFPKNPEALIGDQ